MRIVTEFIRFSTRGNNDIVDITDRIQEKLGKTKLKNGSVLVFAPGATTGITTMEYEPGQIQDLKETVNTLIPQGRHYAHNHSAYGSDGNAHSHLRASFVGSDMTIPFNDSRLLLGTWQQVVFIDFDINSRQRNVVLQFTGE